MRLRTAALPPIVLAAALVAPGACGTGAKSDTSKFSGPAKDVAQAVYDIRDAAAKRDGRKICDSFVTAALRRRLGGAACPARVNNSIRDVDATDLTVTDVQVSGSTATATVRTNVQSGPDPVDTLKLADEQGWRLSQP